MIGQIPEALRSVVETLRPKVAIVHDQTGFELWVDPFAGDVGLPGYTVAMRFGEAPENDPRIYTSPALFFGRTAIPTGFAEIPTWVWWALGLGTAFIVLGPMLTRKRRR